MQISLHFKWWFPT